MYINEKTLGLFTLHSDIRYECWKENIEIPGVLTDPFLESIGYHLVTEIIPDYDRIEQGIRPLTPIKNSNGVWELAYEVYTLDPAIAANNREYAEISNAQNLKQAILALDIKALRYLREGDTVKLAEVDAKAAELLAQIPERLR